MTALLTFVPILTITATGVGLLAAGDLCMSQVVPRLRREGITEEQIRTILVENPKRFLS